MTLERALRQIRTAENRWHQTLAKHRQAPPDTGFSARLADQADACRKMQKAHGLAAEIRGLAFDPLPPGIREPPYELRTDSGRRGPPELWERFDQATVKLTEAWQGTSLQAIADAFGELARTLALLARAVAEQDDVSVPDFPDIPDVPDAPPGAARNSTASG
jgi:hypothetical protein